MATIFASGGYHLLLGEEGSVLTEAYYPDNCRIGEHSFRKTLKKYYDFITGFAAFINVIKVGSVTSSGGNQLETQILIALVLGGMPISGGAKVRFENIIVGSLLYIVLNSGLTMMGFTTQLMQLIQGVVFLVFVAVFADRQSLQVIK